MYMHMYMYMYMYMYMHMYMYFNCIPVYDIDISNSMCSTMGPSTERTSDSP